MRAATRVARRVTPPPAVARALATVATPTPTPAPAPAQPEPSPFAASPAIQKASPPVQNPIITQGGQGSGQWRVVRYGGGRSSVSGITATVFGCTGFLGRYVVNVLGKMGSQVVTPYRGEGMNARHLKLAGDLGQIVPVPYSLYDKESVLRTMARSNVVINLVGSQHTTKNFDLHDVNVKVPMRIAQLAKEAGVERMIHISALGIEPYQWKGSQFLSTKQQGENAVLSVFPEATILRPGPMFGPDDRYLNRLAKIVRFWGNSIVRVPMFGNEADQLVQPVHVVDVAQAIFNSIQKADSQGKIYDLGGLDTFTGREIMERTIKELYRERGVVEHSEAKGILLGKVLEYGPQFRFRMWTEDIIKTARSDLVNKCKYGALHGLTELGISDPRRLEAHISTLLLKHRGMFGPRTQGMTVVHEDTDFDNPLLINNPDYNPAAHRAAA